MVMQSYLPFATVDLVADNPIPAVIGAPEFGAATAAAAATEASKRSLISAASSALIYALVRNVRPQHVVEIGTYNGGTSEVICRALQENGFGILHTVGLFDYERVVPIFKSWPPDLRQHLQFYPMSSMEFYYELSARRIRPEIAFIDGDHSYEAVLYDIQSLAKSLERRGFLILDNVSQAGPYYAAMDFLQRDPDWMRCMARHPQWADSTKAFDRERTSIPETDCEILRAPRTYSIASRPTTFGEYPSGTVVNGLRLDVESGAGTLHAQCILRGFGPASAEEIGQGAVDIRAPGTIDLMFSQPVKIEGLFLRCSAEPWLVWTGAAPLQLAKPPALIAPEARSKMMRVVSRMRPLLRYGSSGKQFIVRPKSNSGALRRLALRVLGGIRKVHRSD
jgi:predicted O-methyltransferase YrrM